MFTKILIANRGEIACRVIATAKRMGIATVAVYSDADKNARHVALADEAVRIGPAASRDSYLLGDVIISAAKQFGAQAIHPGYGFLSENENFARVCEENGIVFIGPKHEAIASMGDKIASKKLAALANVNTIPGVNEAIETADKAVEIANSIGYPVMIKASAGGGGKGLRVAYSDKEASEGFASCRNEARNSFGDDRVFIEKFVEEPRHIEIQLLGDAHGNVLFLNERECSIQRRHQKVIEEAPSPFISDETRQAMGEQAVALAKAVKYQSAGTVEFVVGKDQSFYFLEMNTRLQVEHPVTECITGIDLVEWMIRVAAGEKLPFTQSDIRRDGWAIECRINAEDPFRNFLPSTGRLTRFQAPPVTMFQADTDHLYGVRVDTGVQEGGEIPMHYDSMIAKLIVHGRDRNDAIAKMRNALNAFVIRGINSNIPFQSALLAHPDFVAGQFNTGFIAEHFGKGFDTDDVSHSDADFLIALAAFVRRKSRERAASLSGQLPGYDVKVGQTYTVISLDAVGNHGYTQVEVDDVGGRSTAVIKVNDKNYAIESHSRLNDIAIEGTVNGQYFVAQVERGSLKNPLVLQIQHHGLRVEALVISPRMADLYRLMPFKPPADMSRFVLSPMPGLLVEVAVSLGQKVQAGERVAVIEAMKMENVLFASQDGVVKSIEASKGDSLSVDQVIVEFV
ncbi:MAG: acetyl/propionyl/methylcrotonyl-CoA carboxylase subunit alpha [Burkholderiales bacterium]|nr:acetyl/propionyl/methylcrotonyl-CoA carboxylase subunit alpha [Burkholderiales bacterium]